MLQGRTGDYIEAAHQLGASPPGRAMTAPMRSTGRGAAERHCPLSGNRCRHAIGRKVSDVRVGSNPGGRRQALPWLIGKGSDRPPSDIPRPSQICHADCVESSSRRVVERRLLRLPGESQRSREGASRRHVALGPNPGERSLVHARGEIRRVRIPGKPGDDLMT